MTGDKGETWSPFAMSQVRSRPESLVADCSMPMLQPLETAITDQLISLRLQEIKRGSGYSQYYY